MFWKFAGCAADCHCFGCVLGVDQGVGGGVGG